IVPAGCLVLAVEAESRASTEAGEGRQDARAREVVHGGRRGERRWRRQSGGRASRARRGESRGPRKQREQQDGRSDWLSGRHRKPRLGAAGGGGDRGDAAGNGGRGRGGFRGAAVGGVGVCAAGARGSGPARQLPAEEDLTRCNLCLASRVLS
ncbi:unnamed protein product, partial [Scytosiphon promiscuus]